MSDKPKPMADAQEWLNVAVMGYDLAKLVAGFELPLPIKPELRAARALDLARKIIATVEAK